MGGEYKSLPYRSTYERINARNFGGSRKNHYKNPNPGIAGWVFIFIPVCSQYRN
jgi:hypothetical protein